MESIKKYIVLSLQNAYQKIFSDIDQEELRASLSYPDINFGDIASSIAMQKARILKLEPLEIAHQLASQIEKDKQIKAIEIKAPGYINFIISDRTYFDIARKAYDDWQNYFAPKRKLNSKKRMVIDYSHPNIGKPMGVHHLLSTIIGDAIKLMYRQTGWQAIADNFVGDLGTQFGKLIYAVKQWGNLQQIETDPIKQLLDLYVKYHIESDKDIKLDDAGREEYRKLEEGDPENRLLWEKITAWSKAEIESIYRELGVEFDQMNGESFYEDKMAAILEDGEKKDIFVKDDGALIYRMKDPDLAPAILQKSDGTTLYLTRDLARIDYWDKTWHPDLMANVVDVAQVLHFKQLFEISEKLNLTKATNLHIEFGRMQFSGQGMSTRKGNIFLIEDLLRQSKQKTVELIASKSSRLGKKEKANLAEILAVASIKYNILRQNRRSNITFDWEQVLTLEGSSAPYAAYALSRARSIQEHARGTEDNHNNNHKISFDSQEKQLIRDIIILPEILERASTEFKPNILLHHLYEITQKYSSFYNDKRIIDASDNSLIKVRLLLNNLFLKAVKSGFESLGIILPTHM